MDAHVSKAIFDGAIVTALKGKTRLLVLSSNYHLLSSVDQIVVMENGRVIGSGKYEDLLHKFPKYFKPSKDEVATAAASAAEQDQTGRDTAATDNVGEEEDYGQTAVLLDQMGKSSRLDNYDRMESMPTVTKANLIEKEDREQGQVSMDVYIQYFSGATKTRLGGILLAISIVAIFAAGQAFRGMYMDKNSSGCISSNVTETNTLFLFMHMLSSFTHSHGRLVVDEIRQGDEQGRQQRG